jgi:EmrB/QacA subfamily drug resistance transporter
MRLAHRGALAAVVIASSTVFLDGAIVNIALPRIGSQLPAIGIGVLEGQVYVVAGYMAALAAFLLPGGAIGDMYGRRLAYLAGLVGFGLASLACGLAPSLDLLVIARLLQGIAGALLIPGSLAILAALYEGPTRTRAFGIWTTATSAVVLLAPPLGGLLVEVVGWRGIFMVNVPLVLLALVVAGRAIPELRPEGTPRRFDWPGAVTAAVAIGGLTFGAIRGQQTGWGQPAAIAALGVGAAAVVLFPILMTRRRDPLVPLGLFRNRTFRAMNVSTFLVYGAMYLSLSLQSLFLQGVLGYSPLGAALALLPQGLTLVLLSARAGHLAQRFGTRRFLVGGPLLMAAGALAWLRVGPASAPWIARAADTSSLVPSGGFLADVLPATLLSALGLAIFVVPLTTTLMASIPVDRAGLGSAINNALSRVGQPLFSAIAFILLTGRFYASLAAHVSGIDPADPALRSTIQPLNGTAPGIDPLVAAAAAVASADAFHEALIGAAALFALGALVNARATGVSANGVSATVARAGGRRPEPGPG